MLFAVHISDGVLTWPWLAGGFAIAGLLLALSAWRVHEDEIPRIGLLTAAFFVASLMRVPLPMVTPVHPLLTGMVGVLLGWRSALPIFVGLLLQAIVGHGGYFVLGVNTCIMTAPALGSFLLFQALHRMPGIRAPLGRSALVGVAAVLWFQSAAYAVTLLCNTSLAERDVSAVELANARLIDPWLLGAALLFALGTVAIERRLENAPEFPLGFLIGELSVLATAGLTCAVLLLGGETHWPTPPLLLVIAHLPIAILEGVIVGFSVGFLARVKPEMLGIKPLAVSGSQ